jgi:amino acid transporter
MQAFKRFLTRFGLAFTVPLFAIALAVGALAGMMAWLDGPSEGLLRIGREQGYLPPYFQRVNGKGIEMRILTAQGTVITVIALLYAFIPSVSHAYSALRLLCLVGAASSVAALVIGFVAPSQFGHSNALVYASLILAGILAIGVLPPLLLDRLRKPGWKATGAGSAPDV